MRESLLDKLRRVLSIVSSDAHRRQVYSDGLWRTTATALQESIDDVTRLVERGRAWAEESDYCGICDRHPSHPGHADDCPLN